MWRLNIVPAWIDYTDESLGPCLFLECGEMGSAVSWTEETDETGIHLQWLGSRWWTFGRRWYNGSYRLGSGGGSDETDYNSGALAQTKAGKAIAKGEQEKSDAYFDKIYVGFWDGGTDSSEKLPHPDGG